MYKKATEYQHKKYILLAIKEIYTFVFFIRCTRLYIYFFNNVSFTLSCQISPHEWRIYERDNVSNQYARSKDVKDAETRQKNRVVIQPLIKFELCLGCSRGFTRVALRVYDTSQLRPETVTRCATNFILRYVDWRLEEVRPQWRQRARVGFTASRPLRFSITNRRVFYVFILGQNVAQYDLTRGM